MALSWPIAPTEIRVVGFCGLPVENAAGIESPLFQSPTGHYFAGNPDSAEPPRFHCDARELESLREQGLVTVTTGSWNRVLNGVVLYAHPLFLQPGEGMLALDPAAAGLRWDDRVNLHVTYLRRERALSVLAGWGRRLIRDAEQHLRSRNKPASLQRSLESTRRARLCAPPPEHRDLRERTYVLGGVALEAQGRSAQALLRGAEREFDAKRVDEIRQAMRDWPKDPANSNPISVLRAA